METLLRRSNRDTDDSDGEDLVTQGVIVKGGMAKSITSDGYSEVQSHRTDCSKNCEVILPDPAPPSDGCIKFQYPTDRDYGVVIHDASNGASAGSPDAEIAFSDYEKANNAAQNDLWDIGKSAFFALEVVQLGLDENTGEPPAKNTTYGRKLNVDYWDSELDDNVTLAVGPRGGSNSKILSYSFTMDYLLQSLRTAFIPDSTATTTKDGKEVVNFCKAGSIEVEEVEFDIGEIITQETDRFEFPLCGETSISLADWDEAAENLIKIMENYVEKNISESISRDFVISGYGFNLAGGVCPPFVPKFYIPSIYEGLESISMSLSGGDGVRTTIKIGNKRRKRASANLRREMIVRGMPLATSRAIVPNSVNNTFSIGLQTKI